APCEGSDAIAQISNEFGVLEKKRHGTWQKSPIVPTLPWPNLPASGQRERRRSEHENVIRCPKTEHERRIPAVSAVQAYLIFGIAVADREGIGMITTTRFPDRRGFSLVEMLFVVALTGVVAA